jgi:hypothetical protein
VKSLEPDAMLNAAARRPNASLMSPLRGTDSPAEAVLQVQPADCRNGHNGPIVIRKMPVRFVILVEKSCLLTSNVAAGGTLRVGVTGVLRDAPVHPALAPRR